jgi:hypothetical protein
MSLNKFEIKSAKAIILIFVFSSISSFFYSIFSGHYGGDYLFEDVTISYLALLFNLFMNLIPYFILFKFYLHFKKRNVDRKKFKTSPNFFILLTFFFYLYTLFIVLLYGVGKMEADIYDAPGGIKFVIQIFNRVSFFYIAFFTMILNKKIKIDLFLIFLILSISFLTSGLGAIIYIIFICIVKYYNYISFFLKKHIIIVAFSIFFLPFFVNQLFIIRDNLRHSESKELSTSDLIFGKLAGRLSSFPNSAIILQEPLYFLLISPNIDNYYYQIQAWKALVGGDYRDKKLEYYMKGVFLDNMNVDINSTFMSSTPGNLLFSLIKSPFNFFLNILNILFFLYLIFKVSSMFKIQYSAEYALILSVYPITSGVSSEYVLIITSLFFLLIMVGVNNIILIKK